MLVITQVVGEFAGQRGLQQPLRQLLQHPALAGQLQPAGLGPLDQLLHELRGRLRWTPEQ